MLKEDLNFLQAVSIVANKFNATIDEIDIETKTISLTCPGGKEEEEKCAIAIGEMLEANQKEQIMII